MEYIGIILVAVIAIIGWIKPHRATKPFKIVTVILILFFLIIQLSLQKKAEKHTKIKEYTGKLASKIQNTITDYKTREYVKLEIGNSGTVFKIKRPKNEPLFSFFSENALSIWKENNEIRVSSILRNEKGEIIAEIVANEWKVNEENSYDRNYNTHALEVRDKRGDVVLQVRLVEDKIQFQGKFYDKSGNGIAIVDPESREGIAIMEMTGETNPELKNKIKPIFKYPSELHLGELIIPDK
ncbi:hypothetical protein ACFLUV_02955 [Elusimicrobiota bacterium]